MINSQTQKVGNFVADLIKQKRNGVEKMKIETCKKCGVEVGSSLDDAAYGGDEFTLCDSCRGEPQENETEQTLEMYSGANR